MAAYFSIFSMHMNEAVDDDHHVSDALTELFGILLIFSLLL